ncbi:hypothetical protein MVEN_01454800 [Mycena venus]|uniref:Secreted protein n=1 Tax=Mycena venus TaxID=2733690 RepID=A0A8H6XVA2_9AGAR|nr:hypothetical protein MVEN_01454800 [Mycena venus]
MLNSAKLFMVSGIICVLAQCLLDGMLNSAKPLQGVWNHMHASPIPTLSIHLLLLDQVRSYHPGPFYFYPLASPT